jgi:hypothetical protein
MCKQAQRLPQHLGHEFQIATVCTAAHLIVVAVLSIAVSSMPRHEVVAAKG